MFGMRSAISIVIFWVTNISLLIAQPVCNIEHLSSKDGLSENTVMSILQDHKGFMWFATWDGLSKYDGYSFTNYKVKPGDPVKLSNSRIDKIVEDANGFIWVLLYGRDVCRFDPVKEEFVNVPPNDSNWQGNWFPIREIKCFHDGTVWLISEDEGGLRIETDPHNYQMTFEPFSVKSGNIESNIINDIYKDRDGNEWILTNNGLLLSNRKGGKSEMYFFENEGVTQGKRQSFQAYFEDSNEIWLGSVKGRIWRYQKKGGRFKLFQVPTESSIRSIHQLKENIVFISTFDDGFYIHDLSNGSFKHYSANEISAMPGNTILETYQAKNGDVWIQQDKNGITQYKLSEDKILFHPVKYENFSFNYTKPEFFIVEDINDYLWVHPHGGGFSFYDKGKGELIPFYNDVTSPKMLFSKRLHSIFSDRQGNLWFCTRTKGIEKVTFPQNNFKFTKPFIHRESFLWNDVRALMYDQKGNLWVATKDGRVSVFNKDMKLLGYLNQRGKISNGGREFEGIIYCMTIDDSGIIWLGTKGDGLAELIPNENGDISYAVKRYRFNKDDLYSISHNNIYHIYIDAKSRIWVATFGGGLNLISKDEQGKIKFINHRNNLNGYPINSCYRVRYITSDYNNNICLGTTSGLVTFNEDFVEPESIFFNHYTYQAGDSTCLSNNDIHYIYVTSNRDIYLATFGGGLNKIITSQNDSKLRFKHYNTSDGLPSDVLLAISEDKSGNLWISTENGLSRYNPTTDDFENYDEKEFGIITSFSEAATAVSNDGEVCFGTNNGVLSFIPDKIKKSTFNPSIVFTDLKLFNKSVRPENIESKSITNIDAVSNLVFKHFENVISISYSALEMKNPMSVQFAYMLDGFEDNWNYVGEKRVASYTNLPHGEYVFKVKSTNGDGVWVNNERQMKITILPSFWVTPWAILLYFIIVILLIYITVYILFTIYRLKHKVQVETQLSEMKLNFFTDISHELRTPLTLISGPVESVLKDPGLSSEVREQMEVVNRNTTRMLRLINQILDFVKLRNNKMKLRIEEIELVGFMRHVMDYFRLLAVEKNIRFELNSSDDRILFWGDTDKIEKIVFNLLSNAFKYTEENKIISVSISQNDTSVMIHVRDTGIGINEKKTKDLFERFGSMWQKNTVNEPSSGLGLSVVKELVDMHKGTISVSSKEGKGTEFIIELKKGLAHFNEDVEVVIDEKSESLDQLADLKIETSDVLTEKHGIQLHDKTILLAEDNHDVRSFIKKLLQKNYNIIEAANGEEALEKALKSIPDLIISDLMMPEMNGMELLQSVRNHFDISHIPFIILTAKSDMENQLKGFESGADAYVTKPFSTSYLLARVENLVNQRQMLQGIYQGQHVPDKIALEPSMPVISSHDEKFIDSLMGIMERNMDNGSLVVEDLVSEMAVSRSVFFKKLKTLSGLSPIEFIREMRMKRAAQLITESSYNMSQIAYMVGINDSRYFSKCFKQKYGLTPSKYKESLKNTG